MRGRIAVLVSSVYDSLDTEFLAGVQLAAKSIGYDTLVFSGMSASEHDSYASGDDNIYQLPFMAAVDGFIFAANRFHNRQLKEDIFNLLEKSGRPCVAIEEACHNIQGVFLDQSRPVYEVTKHLIVVHGYQDIICLTGPEENEEAQKRADGFSRAMKAYGLETDDKIVYGDFWKDAAEKLAFKIHKGELKKPQAVVCTSDVMAVALSKALIANGYKIPEDIAVTGYDGSLYTLLTNPTITTVSGGDYAKGIMAVKELSKQMREECLIECPDTKTRLGGSCGCHNEIEENRILLQHTDAMLQKRLDRKRFMFSNYIVKMSDCESMPRFVTALDGLRYMLSESDAINVCLCEDWDEEQKEYRQKGFSKKMSLIYSENQPGQLDFLVVSLLPQLQLEHEPQFWVFTSLHYSDRVLGYVATSYKEAKHFIMDEQYISWCDAVANGLVMVSRKTNMLKMWKTYEEKRQTDIFTGLLSKRGFEEAVHTDETVMLFCFTGRYRNQPYFIPVVSAVLRLHFNEKLVAAHLGDEIFAVVLKEETRDTFIQKLCEYLMEMGIPISRETVYAISAEVKEGQNIKDLLSAMQLSLFEKSVSKHNDTYYFVFEELRREMQYACNAPWNISSAAQKIGLSGSHFQRLYKKYFATSFTADLIKFRLDRARYLLENTDMPIQQVSSECGYTNVEHFMRQFKAYIGISAGNYRKRLN